MKQKGFFFNMQNCIECKACQIACKDKNNLDVGVTYRRVESFEGGKFPNPWVYFLSVSCNHCERPLCVKNCPTGACQKREEDGIVYIDSKRCVGCQMCVKSCPYKAPQYLGEAVKKSGKCNGCIDMTETGGNPVCVDACNMRVLEFGDIEELRRKHNGVNFVRGLPNPKDTNPSIVINPKKYSLR